MGEARSLWQLAQAGGDGFAIVAPDGAVAKAEVVERAADLAEVLSTATPGQGRPLVAVATEALVATVVALLAVSSLGFRAALAGPVEGRGAGGGVDGLAPDVVVYDTVHDGPAVAPAVAIRLCRRSATVLERIPGRSSLWPTAHPADADPADRPFLCFRTSGTTGEPRWVVHSEASLRASLDSKLQGLAVLADRDTVSAADREVIASVARAPRAVLLALTTISGYTQMAHCLALGVPMVAATRFLARRALRQAAAHRVGTLVATPSMLRLLLGVPEATGTDWGRLGVVGLGGGRIHPEVVAAAERTFGARLLQGYGSTELGGAVTNVRITDGPEVRAHTVGRPLGGVELVVARPDGSLVGGGEDGELLVRAPDRLALGYLGPGGAVEPLPLRDGYYVTGDTAVLRGDRNLVVTGRLGHEICRGDEHFSPEEVEAVIEALPGVLRVLVTGEERTGRVLVRADCEVADGAELAASAVREWCRARLPRSRCPEVVAFGTVSTAPTGKVRRRPMVEANPS